MESSLHQYTGQLKRSTSSLDDVLLRATLKALVSTLRTRDAETYEHSKRVLRLGLLLGRECALGRARLRSLQHGALLHDIGKIGVPDAILYKPGRLTGEEWAVMREHAHIGQQMLCELKSLKDVARIVGQHHEKWDGTGYPAGLRGEEIELNARILAVADAFDAMRHNRVYRAGRTFREASEELERCAGTHFDPTLVEAFRRIPRRCFET
ncbi:MAG TPA: HD-GYP domain-containing protein [Pyrinomonadaceae bacterium]|jgi:putative nucleotidyltransferase with HDIG domain|nr:HD-GYP domain-containing protein [Pyrinomonadaceae bacterium]